MSNIDKRALREAAEKATTGVWVYLPQNTSIEYDYGSDDSQGSITYMDSGDFTQKQTALNGTFIAAANPAAVLALLDELEAAEKRSREMAELLINLKKARPGGVYFNKWDTQIDSVLHTAAAGKGKGEHE